MKFLESIREKFRNMYWTGGPAVIAIEHLNETFQQLSRNATVEKG